MIQFNLLPDVKLQYLKAKRVRQMVVSVSVVAIGISLAALILLLATVYIFQKKNLNDINKDIASYTSKVQGTQDLNKILTVQNQLNSLTSLHNQKPVASRVFTYLQQVTPQQASIGQLNIDYTKNTISINGTATSLDIINKYADTLKFTTYSMPNSSTTPLAFSDVVLSSYSITSGTVSYTLTASFDPVIFNISDSVTLSVPNIVSTRSILEQPADLFKSTTNTSSGGQ